MCGLVGMVAHPFADDGDGNVHISGNGCPGVAGNVGGKGHFQAYPFADFLQCTIDVFLHTLILPVFCSVRFSDDGEHIGAVFGQMGIAGNDFLRLFLPLDGEELVGLLSAIAHHSVLQVAFLQEGDVHKGHSAHIETEHEHVAGKGHDAIGRQREGLDGTDFGLGDSAFDGADIGQTDWREKSSGIGQQSCIFGLTE